MKRFLFLIMILAALAAAGSPVLAQPEHALSAHSPVDCIAVRDQLVADPDWQDDLLDPVFTTQEAVRERAGLYQQAMDCLDRRALPAIPDVEHVYEWMDYFMHLAAPLADGSLRSSSGEGELLTFEAHQDPAVVALRDEAGIPAPPGYIYLWVFDSPADMPAGLGTYFTDPSVRGITLLTRYILVLDDAAARSQGNADLEGFFRGQMAETLSHELVHAYVKAALGPEHALSLPEWYGEGMAIFFSNSHRPRSLTFYDNGDLVTVSTVAPENYARYRDAFSYLEQAYGRERFLALVSESISASNPDLLYSTLGYSSLTDLYQRVEIRRVETEVRRVRQVGLAGGGMVLGLVLLLHLVIRWLRRSAGIGDGESEESAAVDPIRGLLAELGDPDPVVRAAAARALGQQARGVPVTGSAPAQAEMNSFREETAMTALLVLLDSDPEDSVRQSAADSLYHLGGAQALPLVFSAARNGSPGFQRWFLRWAAETGQEALLVDLYPWAWTDVRAEIIAQLRARLRDLPDPALQERLSAARLSGTEQFRELISALDDPSSR